MSTDFIEWDGTEACVENLLIWWGNKMPFEHTDECTQPNNMLHCCEGKPNPLAKNYAIRGCSNLRWPEHLSLEFITPDKTVTRVDEGDRIYYRGDGDFELVKNVE